MDPAREADGVPGRARTVGSKAPSRRRPVPDDKPRVLPQSNSRSDPRDGHGGGRLAGSAARRTGGHLGSGLPARLCPEPAFPGPAARRSDGGTSRGRPRSVPQQACLGGNTEADPSCVGATRPRPARREPRLKRRPRRAARGGVPERHPAGEGSPRTRPNRGSLALIYRIEAAKPITPRVGHDANRGGRGGGVRRAACEAGRRSRGAASRSDTGGGSRNHPTDP